MSQLYMVIYFQSTHKYVKVKSVFFVKRITEDKLLNFITLQSSFSRKGDGFLFITFSTLFYVH